MVARGVNDQLLFGHDVVFRPCFERQLLFCEGLFIRDYISALQQTEKQLLLVVKRSANTTRTDYNTLHQRTLGYLSA
eukprot:scaffold4165_cov94-Skeletonema_dohrnii-CCMP3373.AAC.1